MPDMPDMSVGAIRRTFDNLRILCRGFEHYYSAGRWDELYLAGYNFDMRDQDARYGVLLALMKAWDAHRPVLDVGCGVGLMAQKFRQVSSSPFVGVDYSPRAIELALSDAIPACEFFCMDYRQCNFQQQFGIILFNESLYYVDDAAGTMRKFSSFLAPGGVFIISIYQAVFNRSIWRVLESEYSVRRSVVVTDETASKGWRIQVLQPSGRLAAATSPQPTAA